jgi:murein DD-endopeptidase MepM/ murein hydrolase activator NlpD
MIKTLFTALVCGVFLVAQSHAQEIYIGEQKAKPKYPKALPAAADHAQADSPKEKIAAIQPEKTESAPKQAKVAIAPSDKHDVTSAPAKKVAASASESSTKTATNAAATKAPSSKHETAPAVEVSGSAVAHKQPAAAPEAAKKPAIASAKKNISTPVSDSGKPATSSGSSVAPAKSAPQIAKEKDKSPTLEIGGTKPPEILSPAEGPRHLLADHAPKKAPALQAKPPAPALKAVAIALPQSEDPEDEDAPSPHATTKAATVAPPAAKKTIATVKPAPIVIPAPAAVASVDRRKESDAPVRSLAIHETVAESATAVANAHFDTAFTKLADGFDFPVGKPDAQGYYKARGFRSHGHLGEDWDGVGGGDTDLGDPIFSIGDGLVVFARDCHMGWGNVLIVRHSYREGGTVKTVDALYGHLNSMLVHRGQAVVRGQKIATMGTAHGLYDAHLHLEIRRNIEIGMSRAAFAQDFTNYYDPTQFIQAHRHLQAGGGPYRVAMNTFTRDARIRWDKTRNYSHAHTGGDSSESAAALKKALAAKH